MNSSIRTMAGNMVDWWTEGDGQEYEKRVEVMVKQANEYEVHGQAVKVSVSDLQSINASYLLTEHQFAFAYDDRASLHQEKISQI